MKGSPHGGQGPPPYPFSGPGTSPGGQVPYRNPATTQGVNGHVPPFSAAGANSAPSGLLSGSQNPLQSLLNSASQGAANSSESELPGEINDELTSLLLRQDIATSLAEDLLAQFSQGNEATKGGAAASQSSDPLGNLKDIDPFDANSKTNPNRLSPGAAQPDTKPKVKDGKGNLEDLKVDAFLAHKHTGPPLPSPSNLSISMTATQVLNAVRGLGKHLGTCQRSVIKIESTRVNC